MEGGTLDFKVKPEPVSAIGKARLLESLIRKYLRKTKLIKRVNAFHVALIIRMKKERVVRQKIKNVTNVVK